MLNEIVVHTSIKDIIGFSIAGLVLIMYIVWSLFVHLNKKKKK